MNYTVYFQWMNDVKWKSFKTDRPDDFKNGFWVDKDFQPMSRVPPFNEQKYWIPPSQLRFIEFTQP